MNGSSILVGYWMSYNKNKKLNFCLNSISVKFRVFAQFWCSFLAVTVWISKLVLWIYLSKPCEQQELPETGQECKDWSMIVVSLGRKHTWC